MLKLSKKGLSNSYRVTGADGAELTVLSGCGSGQTGKADIAGSSLVFAPETEPGHFEMTKDDAPAGSAARPHGINKHFVIRYLDQILELDCPFIGNKPYDATVAGQRVGSISLSKFTGRVVTVDLPESIPLDTRLFAGWLALRTWNSSAEVKIVVG